MTTPLYIAALVLAGLDARYGWSAGMPIAVYLAGVAIYLIGQGIFQWARYTNRFFSSVVRIQTDRGHTVCREGPYRIVRHPGYVGGILYTAAMGLALGSWWACLPQTPRRADAGLAHRPRGCNFAGRAAGLHRLRQGDALAAAPRDLVRGREKSWQIKNSWRS